MRLLTLPLLLVGALLAGCSSSSDGEADRSTPPSPSARSSGPSAAPSAEAGGRDAVCARVRAGIEAFNAGDFEQTVSDFEEAVPLATRAQRTPASTTDRLLLRAVRYYADLPPEDYPEAARSSAAFQRWKAVTLGLCVSGQDQLSPSPQDSGIPA